MSSAEFFPSMQSVKIQETLPLKLAKLKPTAD